mmetsp:Transcript_24177/g.45869  ORF Transcript_24177/g.45869 Transcript_24177/m.45869 type:complete len:383 (+) Transcript_24177:22-1170(+)
MKYGCSSSTVSSLICSLGNESRVSRNLESDIIFTAMSYEPSITISPLFSIHPTLCSSFMRSTITVSKMRLMMSGGFFSAFSAPMSFAVMDARASTAASMAGCASARSFSASSFTAAISFACAVTLSTITTTFAFSFSATAVPAEISLSRFADTFCASARSAFLMASSPFILLTSALASNSFCNPELILSASTFTSDSLREYSSLYPEMNERYDLGVTYARRRYRSKYSVHAVVTLLCTSPMCSCRPSLASSEHAMGKSPMNLDDTAVRAWSGHGRNQSMVHPLIKPGNWEARREKASPTGEKHRQTCRLLRTRPMKKLYRLSHVSTVPGSAFFIAGRMSLTIMSSSSLGNKPATSPVIRIWLMYSRKPSSFTSESVNMKHTF